MAVFIEMAAFISTGQPPISRNICDLWEFNVPHTPRGEPPPIANATEWFAIGVASAGLSGGATSGLNGPPVCPRFAHTPAPLPASP